MQRSRYSCRRLPDGGLADGCLVLTIGHFDGLGGPGDPENLLKGYGAKLLKFLKGFPPARDRPDSRNDRFSIKSQNPPRLNPPSGSRRSCLMMISILQRGQTTWMGWLTFVRMEDP